jgi:hypothetical protein
MAIINYREAIWHNAATIASIFDLNRMNELCPGYVAELKVYLDDGIYGN